MSVKLMSSVWELDLPPGEKLVLLALADRANDEGRQCWPSVEWIMSRSGQGERTVRRLLASLERAGHLTCERRPGTSTEYHVHPCQNGTPAKMAPLPKTTESPATVAPPSCQNGTQSITYTSISKDKGRAGARAAFRGERGAGIGAQLAKVQGEISRDPKGCREMGYHSLLQGYRLRCSPKQAAWCDRMILQLENDRQEAARA